MARCIWLTGLPASGKTTLGSELVNRLNNQLNHVCPALLLDGDVFRQGLNSDLGFSETDRREAARRVAETARWLLAYNTTPVVAMISPYRSDRDRARRLFAPGAFFEIFVDCPVAVCAQRDPRYNRAADGEIASFTGVSARYEAPENPELVVRTDQMSLTETVRLVLSRLGH
jgi:adenylyl-sulfate kinase